MWETLFLCFLILVFETGQRGILFSTSEYCRMQRVHFLSDIKHCACFNCRNKISNQHFQYASDNHVVQVKAEAFKQTRSLRFIDACIVPAELSFLIPWAILITLNSSFVLPVKLSFHSKVWHVYFLHLRVYLLHSKV